jgi:hypothetical protein
MIGPREVFAMAERHAWWCRVTFNADVHEIRRELEHWRNRYGLALSTHALTVIAHHVHAATPEDCERAA